MDKIEMAKRFLQELDRASDRDLVSKAKRMLVLQNVLSETKKQLRVSN